MGLFVRFLTETKLRTDTDLYNVIFVQQTQHTRRRLALVGRDAVDAAEVQQRRSPSVESIALAVRLLGGFTVLVEEPLLSRDRSSCWIPWRPIPVLILLPPGFGLIWGSFSSTMGNSTILQLDRN